MPSWTLNFFKLGIVDVIIFLNIGGHSYRDFHAKVPLDDFQYWLEDWLDDPEKVLKYDFKFAGPNGTTKIPPKKGDLIKRGDETFVILKNGKQKHKARVRL